MNRRWFQSYGDSVPTTIDPDNYASLVEIFEQSVGKFRDRPAYHNLGKTITFDELDRLSRDFAAYLQSSLGLVKGDRFAIMLPNILQYPVALFGALRLGLVVVNINPLFTSRELEEQLSDSSVRAIFVLRNFCAVLSPAIKNTSVEYVITSELGDLLGFPKSLIVNFVIKYVKKLVPPYRIPGELFFRQALRTGQHLQLKSAAVTNSDTAFLQYTGGTTGISKGAVLTHRNMVANMEQISAWIHECVDDGQDVVITALPLYHIFCLSSNCLTYMKHGGLNVLITNPRDMSKFITELSKWRFTAITGVNTLFNALLNTAGFNELDFSHIKLAVGGGMPVQRTVAEKWRTVTGTKIIEGYGLTECSPVVCVNPVHWAGYTGAIGVPVPSTDVTLRDEFGSEVSKGEIGEICVSGPQVMQGYWRRSEETKKVFFGDWLRTGDLATIDEAGFFYILDRKKDMILVSGFNVFPNEVEEILSSHPRILECACIGVPDEHTGEAVKVFVVCHTDDPVTCDEIKSYCKQQLTTYKVPKHVEFRSVLPKSNIGKIMRRHLR